MGRFDSGVVGQCVSSKPKLRGQLSTRIWLPAILLTAMLATIASPLRGQGMPTAARLGDLQIGGGLALGKSDYGSDKVIGGGLYSSFDFKRHLGVELDIRQVNSTSDTTIYERTYEVGGRYHLNYGPAIPYAKVMVGRGVFNYPNAIANLAYNMFSAGAGVDFHVARSVNMRVEYEFQQWAGFPLAPLRPQLISIGVAYHFHE